MEIVYNEQIQEIRQYFQDFSEEDITTLYQKAYREITRRIGQLSSFEDIDQDVIYDDESLVHEIQDSIRNLTLSYIQFERDHQQYGHRYQNIFEFVEQENISDVFFEQSVTEGHPFHPLTKTKLGFSIDDVIKFSPEFRQTVNVIPLLCNKDFIDEINIYQSPALETFKKKINTYCKEHGIKFENYALLFIHEWQLKHFLLPQFETCFEQQFMIPLHDLDEAIQICHDTEKITLTGFHFHAMSNNLDEDAHVTFIESALEFTHQYQSHLPEEYAINVGGGIGIDYDEQKYFDFDYFATRIHHLPRLTFELGRFITGPIGYYAAHVYDIKSMHDQTFVLLNGGTNHFRFPKAWQHHQTFEIIHSHSTSNRIKSITNDTVVLAGKLCTPNDVFGLPYDIESIQTGDWVVFKYAGSYGYDISHLQFLSHELPLIQYI